MTPLQQDRRFFIMLAVVLPLVIYLILRLFPQLDPVWSSGIFHFYIVTFTSLVAVISASFMFLIVANRTPEQTFLILAFISMATLFTTHGLATPGIILPGLNIAVGWSARLSLTVGAVFALLSVLSYSTEQKNLIMRYRNAIALFTAIILLSLITLMFAAPPFVEILTNSIIFSLIVTLATISLLLWATWLAWRKYQQSHQSLYVVLVINYLWLASAQISQYEAPIWQFSWWMYHLWMLAAFTLTMIYMVANYERTETFRLTRYFLSIGVIIGAALVFVQSELAVTLSAQDNSRWSFTAAFTISIALLVLSLLILVYRAQQILNDRAQIIEKEKQWRTDMTSLMAHDLMSPLNSVLLDIDLIGRREVVQQDTYTRERINRIQKSTQTIAEMLYDMLSLERLEAGSLELDLKKVDMTTLLKTGVEQAKSVAEYRHINIELKLPQEPVQVAVDEKIMQRVIQNLLGNALKFAPEGGQVELETHINPADVQVSISDNGPGIPDEKKAMIFTRFGQLRNEDRDFGFGLGLAFCKIAVEAHQGQIRVEDRPTGGSRFTFQLPHTNTE